MAEPFFFWMCWATFRRVVGRSEFIIWNFTYYANIGKVANKCQWDVCSHVKWSATDCCAFWVLFNAYIWGSVDGVFSVSSFAPVCFIISLIIWETRWLYWLNVKICVNGPCMKFMAICKGCEHLLNFFSCSEAFVDFHVSHVICLINDFLGKCDIVTICFISFNKKKIKHKANIESLINVYFIFMN